MSKLRRGAYIWSVLTCGAIIGGIILHDDLWKGFVSGLSSGIHFALALWACATYPKEL